jgi:tetrathionate reductase subunit A
MKEENNSGTANNQNGGKKMNRIKFLKKLGLVGVAGLVTKHVLSKDDNEKINKEVSVTSETFEYHRNDPENMIYSVCLNCNTGCPTKVKIQNGNIVKLDGNPYSPWNKMPFIPYNTPLNEAAKIDGALCPKGQAGLMTVQDPYRIKKVLKRSGPRGSQKWQSIDFETAIEEIVAGGKLFAHVAGEENRNVEGLKDIIVLKDKNIAGDMSKAIDEIWAAKEPEEKKIKINEFKIKFADHLHYLIDPDHPDLGPKNNQFVWVHGRLKAGRSDFFKRFVQDSLGSNNFHGHTTVCQGSLYFTGKAMSEQFGFDEKKQKVGWHGGDKFFWQADQHGAEFIIFAGSSPFEANYPPLRVPNITNGVAEGRLKYAVIDPRYSKTCVHAWKWIPNKPGYEAAIALGMTRWILENMKYDEKYLKGANKAAAFANGEPTYTNACWLVQLKDGKPEAFLRASDIGLPKQKLTVTVKDKEGKESPVSYEYDPFITMVNGNPVTFNNNDEDEKAVVNGDLLVDSTVKGINVKSVMQLLTEEANSRSIAEWAELAGCSEEDIIVLAKEFTSHGKKAVFDMHRGVSQHTNGFYNCYAGNTLNLLIGNYDWKGGSVKASTYDISGNKAGGPFNFNKGLSNGKQKPFGLGILRNLDYEKSTMFSGYPAKRPWFPHCTDVYQEILPSIEDDYPYPVKALLLYMGSPGYALPAGQTQLKVLADVQRLPLFIASDITIGESSMFADYIIPDLAFYERWEFHGSHPNNIWKVQTVRQPAMAPVTETVKVFGEDMPISLESFMMAVAEKMHLKPFGKNGFEEGMNFMKPEDMYLKMIANIAFGEKPDGSDAVPDADEEELRIFAEARKHLPATVYDYDRWKSIVGDNLWPKVVYVMNRGGRFQDYSKAYEGEKVKNKYGKLINMYSEKVAKSKNSMTGKSLKAMAAHIPIADSMGNPIKAGDDTLHLITFREIFHTKSRTIGNKLLRELYPVNYLLINPVDADKLNLASRDKVRIVSDSNPDGWWELPNYGKKHVIGEIKVTEGIRPGVITFSLSFGHWAYGSADVEIDGQILKGDPLRGAGFHANAAMMIDPHLKNISIQDLVGGSVSFYDSPVRLEKVNNRIENTLEIARQV